MLDVNEWEFQSKEAGEKFHEGYSLVTKAVLERRIKGLDDSAIRRKIVGDLKKGAQLLEEALSLEHAKSPLPHAQLARANAHIGLALYYQEGTVTPETKSHFDKATSSAATAVTCYEQSTGWDAGNRFDLHLSIAQIRFFQDDLEEARQELDNAGLFRSETALFPDLFDSLSKTLSKIERSSPTKARPDSGTKSGGCLGVVGGGIVLLAIVILAVILGT